MDDDDGEPERDQDAALELVGPELGQQELVDHQPDQHGDHDGGGQRRPVEQADHRQGEGHGEGAQHQELAVREVDDLHDAEDQRQADGDQGIDQAQRDAVQRQLHEIDGVDGHCGPSIANPGPCQAQSWLGLLGMLPALLLTAGTGSRVEGNKMKTKFWLAAAVACVLGAGSAAAQQPIVIGVSTPQTGVAAVASEWEMWGVNLAVEEINAAGGLLGRKVELMVLDNKCNPSEAVNVANKLVEAKVVAIEGAHCSSAHLASMKIVADAKIPMITGIASNPQITDLAGPGRNEYAFRLSPSDQAMMDALGIYLGAKKLFKTVAIVSEDTDFGRGGADAFKAVAGKAGIEIVSSDFHPQGAPDFTSILTRLQQRKPDGIATFQTSTDSINFLLQAMQDGLKIPYTRRIELGGRHQPDHEARGIEKSH